MCLFSCLWIQRDAFKDEKLIGHSLFSFLVFLITNQSHFKANNF